VRRLALLVVALLGLASADAGAEPAQQPEWPLHLIRFPFRSAVIERGCGFGVLSFGGRAELSTHREWVGQVAGFGRCSLPGRLQVRLNVPVVVAGFYSQFEGISETGPGNPLLEVKWQALAWRGIYASPYLAAAVDMRHSGAGQFTPGVAVSALVRGVSLHGHAEAQLPFGVSNARRTYSLGLSVSHPLPHHFVAHLGFQDAVDPLESSFWSDARAVTAGAAYALSTHWVLEAGVRVGPRPEAELVFNSLAYTAYFINLVNRPAPGPRPPPSAQP